MIVVALYPDGITMSQLYLPFAGTPGYSVSDTQYNKAMDHYTDVQSWCDAHLVGPWSCNPGDILHVGVRVRIGSLDDLAYFCLKWSYI